MTSSLTDFWYSRPYGYTLWYVKNRHNGFIFYVSLNKISLKQKIQFIKYVKLVMKNENQ